MSDWTLIEGDALASLVKMEPSSVHCCITSPPYYGLRDYGTGEWNGGNPACDHKRDLADKDNLARSAVSTRGGGASRKGADLLCYGSICGKCGARRIDQQIGLEDTPEEYVAKLVEVFAEVKRVLRDDGTLWLNLGDTYNNRTRRRKSSHQPGLNDVEDGSWSESARSGNIRTSLSTGDLKQKDLIGIPWMVAFALRADGWYLRSEIIWSKPNPMPASVTDRPTVAHETIFLLAKSERYYYDGEAIRETDKKADHPRNVLSGQLSLSPSGGRHAPHTGLRRAESRNGAGANKRSVWSVATRPYPEAHFATYPAELIEPMVLAGCPREVCGVCGAPWERRVQRVQTGMSESVPAGWDTGTGRHHGAIHRDGRSATPQRAPVLEQRTVGWRASRPHLDAETMPGVVLDPFAGSGTTLQVAVANGRAAVGIELNPDYCALVRRRLEGVTPSMFDAASA